MEAGGLERSVVWRMMLPPRNSLIRPALIFFILLALVCVHGYLTPLGKALVIDGGFRGLIVGLGWIIVSVFLIRSVCRYIDQIIYVETELKYHGTRGHFRDNWYTLMNTLAREAMTNPDRNICIPRARPISIRQFASLSSVRPIVNAQPHDTPFCRDNVFYTHPDMLFLTTVAHVVAKTVLRDFLHAE